MSFDINITVNGSRCKQYYHNKRTYIQANPGSEYVIEIKNNHYKRILAVGSVDGLNVLTGKTASESDSGYIIGSYSSEKIKGFRFSDNEWAMFKFGYKFNGKTYAQSKEDGSEKNCGIIGMRLFYENEPVITCSHPQPFWNTDDPIITWTTCNASMEYLNHGGNDFYTTAATDKNSQKISKKRNLTGGIRGQSATLSNDNNVKCSVNYFCSVVKPKPEFDMGTEWGRKESSKVRNVTFDRGCLAQSFDIYYASREALIAMGVPLTNELVVNLPQSFPSEYAQPPKGWNG